MAPAGLAPVDAVLATHAHTDHLDPGTLAPLCAASPEAVLVAPHPARELAAARAGIDERRVVGLEPGGAAELPGFRVRAVPAAHEALSAEFVGYVITAGPFRVLHTGDTVAYEGQAEVAGPVDVALLPINGRGIPGTPGNLDAEEAAALAAALPARVAVPCHFGMFAFNSADPAPFAAACARLGVGARVLRPGERATVQPATDASASTARR
jgi:L-ascorbate metabolism protein UlaG (beta-lactamase superfamily)